MRSFPFLPALLAVGVLAACDDAKQPPVAAAPTAPAPSEASLSVADAPNVASALNKQVASVCKAYRKAGVQMKKDLQKSPDDQELQEQAKALNEMIDDACN